MVVTSMTVAAVVYSVIEEGDFKEAMEGRCFK